MDGWELLGGAQTNKALDWTGRLENEVDDVGLCLGFLAGDESAERGRRRDRGSREREKEKEKEKEKKKCRRITM